MILGILGIVLLLLGIFLPSADLPPSVSTVKLAFRAFGGLFTVIAILVSVFVVIPPGVVGVQSLFGKVSSTILPSGLQVINPFAEVTEFDTRTQNYTMSAVHDEGKKQGDDAIRILSKDGLEVIIDISVLYRIEPSSAPKIYATIGTDYEEKIVRPLSRTRIRDNSVYYDAVSLFSNKRDEFQSRITAVLEKDFSARGLKLEQLLVKNITLPASVKQSIESKINAEQDAQKMTFVLDKERQEAERKRVEAQGIADYQKIINIGLSDKQLQYEMIQAYRELATSQNAKIIMMGNGKQPIILDGK